MKPEASTASASIPPDRIFDGEHIHPGHLAVGDVDHPVVEEHGAEGDWGFLQKCPAFGVPDAHGALSGTD